MSIVSTIFFTIIALGVLVSFHEFGHFWVARRCGVKVLRFSIGFGKPLLRWRDKRGTEYVIAWLPLGGYVRMVDEREDEVAPEDRPYAFNRKSVWKRMAIVLAGPVANFVLAVVAYWVVFVHGMAGIAPVIGEVVPGSIAAKAGLEAGQEIIAVDGKPTPTLQQLQERLVNRIGDSGEIRFTVSYPDSQVEYTSVGTLDQWMGDSDSPELLNGIGIAPYRPSALPIAGEIVPDSPAERAGLKVGDRIVSADGQPIPSWRAWLTFLQERPGETISVAVERDGENLVTETTLDSVADENGRQVGRIGMGIQPQTLSWPEHMRRDTQYGPLAAVGKALIQTGETSAMILGALKKMVTGRISAKHLSGPITIAKVAGQTAEYGLVYFLKFMALLSVSLGVLNLLPIPVLDGGHLMYYIVEAVKGSPVSEKVQMLGYRVGLFLVIGLMAFALYNDFMRL